MGVKSSACGEILPDLRHAQTTSPATSIAIREAADRLKRRWIGIDIPSMPLSALPKFDYENDAIYWKAVTSRSRACLLPWKVRNICGKHDKYHFQQWSIEQVDGFVTSKRTADGGIDGRLISTFSTSASSKAW